MSKRMAFILTMVLLHLMTTATVVMASRSRLARGNSDSVAAISARVLLNPVYYPVRRAANANHLAAPLILANSFLWGVMAERLVSGRKTIYRKKRSAGV